MQVGATVAIVALGLMALGFGVATAAAEPAPPLAAHRAAYELSLAGTDMNAPPSGQTPISASGLIAYEFQGSACEGYAANFRQVIELQRNEGDPVSSDVSSQTFEDGDGKTMRFEIEAHSSTSEDPPISGAAARSASGATTVELYKPSSAKIVLDGEILFPTQHMERIIAAARRDGGTLEARVYDGSDSGRKVFATLAVIGRAALAPSADADAWPALATTRRWPVTVSYFDESRRDAPPDYTLSFDLYENGVTGALKLDYGAFALNAKLAKLEWLKTAPCAK